MVLALVASACGESNYLEEFEIADLELESGVVNFRFSETDGYSWGPARRYAVVMIVFDPVDEDTPIEVLFDEAVAAAEAQGWEMEVRRGPLDPPREYPHDQPCGAGGVRPVPTDPDQLVTLGITCMRMTLADEDGEWLMNLVVALRPVRDEFPSVQEELQDEFPSVTADDS